MDRPTPPTGVLKTGESLRVAIYEPGVTEPPVASETIRDLVVQPRQPWFGPAERAEVERGLAGRLVATSRDVYLLGLIGDELVGVTWYQVSRRTPEIGAFGYVFIEPAHQGQGIGYRLGQTAVDRFRHQGGLCLYLGTVNPVAHHVYERCGFADYNGIVMRYLTPPQIAAGFDETLFADCGPARIRPVEWGDGGMVDALYAAPYPSLIRDYALRSFSHPAIRQTRCHIFPSIMLSLEQEDGACLVLENPRGRLVGVGRLERGDARVEPHSGLVDFIVQPSYQGQAAELVAALLAAASQRGCTTVRAWLAACDAAKRAAALAAGFRREAMLRQQLRAGDAQYDLELFTAAVGG